MAGPDPALRQWATDKQARYLDAVIEYGSHRGAAKALGCSHQGVDHAMIALRKKAALAGYAPDHDMRHPVPSPFKVKGVSTYYDREGEARGQWVKSTLDREALDEMMKAAAVAMAEEMPRLDPIEGPASVMAELCNLYVMTDCHVGMLAWAKEAGEPWDLKIAARDLVGCFEQMVLRSPPAKVAVISQLGDFLHYDGLTPETPKNRNVLDADGRFSKMVGVAIHILRRLIDIALMRHEQVYLILAEGNHDPASSVWLRHMFKALYENEPRLTVDDSELPYYVYQHGKTMLAFHHGHLKKVDSLPLLFAATHPVMWGETTKRYCHTGHRHFVEEKGHSGMLVVQHPTLAARDAYAARGGWVSEREASATTYHTSFGQVGRATVCPEMLST